MHNNLTIKNIDTPLNKYGLLSEFNTDKCFYVTKNAQNNQKNINQFQSDYSWL